MSSKIGFTLLVEKLSNIDKKLPITDNNLSITDKNDKLAKMHDKIWPKSKERGEKNDGFSEENTHTFYE